jgi:hypothetical protein
MFLELKNLLWVGSSLFAEEVGKRSVHTLLSMREFLPRNNVTCVNGMRGTFLHRDNSGLKL